VSKVVNTKKEAQAAVDCVFASITQALKKKGAVTLVGFGTFKVGKRKARTGRNPKPAQRSRSRPRTCPGSWPGKP